MELLHSNPKEYSVRKTTELFKQEITRSLKLYPLFTNKIFDISIVDPETLCKMICNYNEETKVIEFCINTKYTDGLNILKHPYFNCHTFKQLSISFFENLYGIDHMESTYNSISDNYKDFMSIYQNTQSKLLSIQNTHDYKDNSKHKFYISNENEIEIFPSPYCIHAIYRKGKKAI